MEPEQTISSKKFFIIPIGVVVLVVASLAVLWTRSADAPTEIKQEVATPKVERVYTEAEKMQILADIAASAPKSGTSEAQNLKTLQNLSKTAPPDTTSTEDKLRILKSLSSGSN